MSTDKNSKTVDNEKNNNKKIKQTDEAEKPKFNKLDLFEEDDLFEEFQEGKLFKINNINSCS